MFVPRKVCLQIITKDSHPCSFKVVNSFLAYEFWMLNHYKTQWKDMTPHYMFNMWGLMLHGGEIFLALSPLKNSTDYNVKRGIRKEQVGELALTACPEFQRVLIWAQNTAVSYIIMQDISTLILRCILFSTNGWWPFQEQKLQDVLTAI